MRTIQKDIEKSTQIAPVPCEKEPGVFFAQATDKCSPKPPIRGTINIYKEENSK